MSKGITRRDALKGMGALAGAALVGPRLAGCGSDAATPGEITNIVVLMMENRSYDHYMGSRKLLEGLPGDGLVAGMANPNNAGDSVGIFPVSVECVADPPHGWDAGRVQLNGGANDGFMKAYQDEEGDDIPPHVMGYLNRADLPVSYALADAYTHCDRWFSSVLGPTWPNRFYLHSAQSGGLMDNSVPSAPWPTIYDRLTAAKVKWSYYYTDLPFLLTLGVGAGNFHGVGSFYTDAAAGLLPPVSILDPGFAMNDDHPPHHPILGQQFIASIYNALATSPQWKNSLLVVTYDECGGFYDHVVPPLAADDRAALGFNQLGFRVPAMIVGPYVKTGYVSSTVHDHTSVLKHIENMFSLEPLTMRDAAANDLSDALDLDRLAAGDATVPVMVPSIDVDPSTLDAACNAPSMVKPTELMTMADQGLIAPELDLRPTTRELMHYINERLRR